MSPEEGSWDTVPGAGAGALIRGRWWIYLAVLAMVVLLVGLEQRTAHSPRSAKAGAAAPAGSRDAPVQPDD